MARLSLAPSFFKEILMIFRDRPLKEIGFELLFWAHLGFILFAILIGLFLPLSIVAGLVLLHRIHIFHFRGCVFTHFQKRIGGLPKDVSFLQFAFKRLFNKNISLSQSKKIDYAFSFSVLTLALIGSFWNRYNRINKKPPLIQLRVVFSTNLHASFVPTHHTSGR